MTQADGHSLSVGSASVLRRAAEVSSFQTAIFFRNSFALVHSPLFALQSQPAHFSYLIDYFVYRFYFYFYFLKKINTCEGPGGGGWGGSRTYSPSLRPVCHGAVRSVVISTAWRLMPFELFICQSSVMAHVGAMNNTQLNDGLRLPCSATTAGRRRKPPRAASTQ